MGPNFRLKAILAGFLCAFTVACGGEDEIDTRREQPDDGNENNVEQDMSGEEDMTGEADMGMDLDVPDIPIPRIAVGIETSVLSNTVTAGEEVVVTCQILDQEGLPFTPEGLDSRVDIAPEGAIITDMDSLIAVQAGVATVRCSLPDLGLVDETPEEVTIAPGPVFEVTTELDLSQMAAGDTVSATCGAFDEYGNDVSDATFELVVAPSDSGVTIDMLAATITTSGVYEVSCTVSGATLEESELVEVVPGAPAALAISLIPNESVYAVGQVVSLSYTVTDEFGNVIPDAGVNIISTPNGDSFGQGRFRYTAEGTYTIQATVTDATNMGQMLQQEVTFTVNSDGPDINCDTPFDGQMIDAAPGSTLTFNGSVGDANGVSSVTVNGTGVAVSADGSFANTLLVDWGINFVEIVAEDTFGEQNSRTCAFLASDDWDSPFSYLDDSISLKLLQGAIDDNATGDIDSLNDLLYRVLNSSGLRNELHSALTAANPLKPDSCDQQVCVFGACACVFRSSIVYRNITIGGPQSSSLDLVPGGLRATATARNLDLEARVESTLYDGTGHVELDSISVDLTLDVGLVNGQPSASVRQVNAVNVGNINLDFPGFGGLIIDILEGLFEGTIRNLIRDTMRDFIEDSFNQVLDDVFSSLDVSTLGTSFNIPQLDGTGTVRVNFGLDFSSIQVLGSRATFGLGTRFLPASTTVGTPTLGVARQPGLVLINPTTTTSAVVAIHISVINQVLHALWKGGFFRATIDGSTLGGNFPAGTQATIDADLPPVVELVGSNQARLTIGAINLNLIYPGIFDAPGLPLKLGGVGQTSVQLVGDDLSFGNVTLQQIYFSTPAASLDASTRAILQNFLQGLLQAVIDASLNDSLPALPIPSFEIPQSLAQYNLPAGEELGIVSPTLYQFTRHFVLRGNFGIR